MNAPKTEDIEMFDNGVVYIRTHFVTVPLTYKNKKEIDFISKSYNAVNAHDVGNLYNVMFQNAEDAKAFAKKINEQ